MARDRAWALEAIRRLFKLAASPPPQWSKEELDALGSTPDGEAVAALAKAFELQKQWDIRDEELWDVLGRPNPEPEIVYQPARWVAFEYNGQYYCVPDVQGTWTAKLSESDPGFKVIVDSFGKVWLASTWHRKYGFG